MELNRCMTWLLGAALAGSALSTTRAQDAAAGQRAYVLCMGCHGDKGVGGAAGPALRGVLGRAPGQARGFAYSTALKAAGGTWDEASLDRYLEAPSKAVPGTTMVVNVAAAQQRRDLIAYLATLK
jgi:cytochrome c